MPAFLENFWNNNQELVLTWAYRIGVAIFAYFVSKIVAGTASKYIRKLTKDNDAIDDNLTKLLCYISSAIIYAIGAVIVLELFGMNTNGLVAILGTAGLAIGLALKDTLSNIAAGVVLLVLRPLKIGEFVECAGVSGTVEEISFLTTVLKTPDGLMVTAPNSLVWGATITNYSRHDIRRVDLTIGIDYNDSVEEAIQVLQQVAEKEELFLQDPKPEVVLTEMADSSVNLQLRAWTKTENYWPAYWSSHKAMKSAIEQAGISIPFPHRVLQIQGGQLPS